MAEKITRSPDFGDSEIKKTIKRVMKKGLFGPNPERHKRALAKRAKRLAETANKKNPIGITKR